MNIKENSEEGCVWVSNFHQQLNYFIGMLIEVFSELLGQKLGIVFRVQKIFVDHFLYCYTVKYFIAVEDVID